MVCALPGKWVLKELTAGQGLGHKLQPEARYFIGSMPNLRKEKSDLIRPGMDIVRRQREIMAEVENLASEKSALESIVAETTTQLLETSEKLQEVRVALDVAEKEKSQMQKQKDDVVQALAQMLQEKLEMQRQRDDAIKEMEELCREQAAGTMLFSQAELEDATNNFGRSLIVGQGGVGTVYKARLHHTAVAIKRLNVDRLPCGHEMDWEVFTLLTFRRTLTFQ
ncbi:hypothetical protein EJ110_NYTH08052 [Nymphaea thermarum]|nr:hypothetical protein EJ110_NYTH08052 [Nymphaea thermarum]